MNRLSVAAAMSFLAISAWLPCQPASGKSLRSQAPVAIPQDVRTVDAVIRALYEVISGPARQKRDWDRFRSLFSQGARLIPAVARMGEKPVLRSLDVEEYIRRTSAFFPLPPRRGR